MFRAFKVTAALSLVQLGKCFWHTSDEECLISCRSSNCLHAREFLVLTHVPTPASSLVEAVKK